MKGDFKIKGKSNGHSTVLKLMLFPTEVKVTVPKPFFMYTTTEKLSKWMEDD